MVTLFLLVLTIPAALPPDDALEDVQEFSESPIYFVINSSFKFNGGL